MADHTRRSIRLTHERKGHILEHPEMVGQFGLIGETLTEPDRVVETNADKTVHVFEMHYAKTPVTSKYLLVTVKVLSNAPLFLTAFFSSRQKKGSV